VARERYRINDKASVYTGEGNFSVHLRSQAPGINAAETYKVVQVLDGDTIEVEAGGKTVRVRYIGIDTPEMNYDQRKVRDCYANEAKVKNESLVLDKSVQLVRDVRDKDDYGRLLRYVYADGVFVNQELVLGGYARAIAVGKDTARYEELKASETAAKNDERGIWSAVCR
jgi:micrococcal nuclease